MTLFDVRLYARANAPHQVRTAQALQQGFKRHGIRARIDCPQEYQPCDLAVVWSNRHKGINAGQRVSGADYLVAERGYLGDREWYTSLGFNGLNGRADFHADSVPGDRGAYWTDMIKPWRVEGGLYYLVMGQVLGDMSLEGIDFAAWVRSLPVRIDGLPVYFRRHPVRHNYNIPHTEITGTLAQALARAAGVITWNSNSGVDAVLAGVPVVAYDQGSMIYEDVGHAVGDWRTPDQRQIVNRLAYCQWSLDEIAAGDAWEHLRTRYA